MAEPRPQRTRDWTEMDVLRKILFELRKLNELMDKHLKQSDNIGNK